MPNGICGAEDTYNIHFIKGCMTYTKPFDKIPLIDKVITGKALSKRDFIITFTKGKL